MNCYSLVTAASPQAGIGIALERMGEFSLCPRRNRALGDDTAVGSEHGSGTWIGTGWGSAALSLARPWPRNRRRPEELTRKAKVKVAPVYPDVARRMSIVGTVRLAVVVEPNGTVKSSKPVGGHPVLVNAAMDAVKQWKFEPAPTESSGIVEFKFQPQN